MNDCEYEVLDRIKAAVATPHPSLGVSAEPLKAPPSMPWLEVLMIDCFTDRGSLDSGTRSVSRPTFQITAYSARPSGRKAECKGIMATVDAVMAGMNFLCTSCMPVMNMQNDSIYRLVARYEGATDGTTFYRR